jgi:hypothetical protein
VSVAVYQVRWTPGSDELVGICHCGAEHVAEDPIDVWEWLLAHPDGHSPVVGSTPREPATAAAG